MCGIAGITVLDGEGVVDEDIIHRMTQSMTHRGPDDEGYHVKGPIGLGHRRLSIIDVQGGHQPMSNKDASVWVIFNGEIYNHRELRQELEKKGYRHKTSCDTETIIHAYEEYGEACLHHLQGMFAFAVWDTRQKKLLLARDRLGIKPLYYFVRGNKLAFASEAKALLTVLPDAPSIDIQSLDCFLSLSYVPAPWTLFDGIIKLPAGHLLTVANGEVSVRKYWDLEFENKWSASEEELKERFRTLLMEAVQTHLMSEVPLGVFLSGGLDSSCIVYVMTQVLGVPCTTFSVGYEGDLAENEFDAARQVSNQFGTTHHEYRIGALDFVKELHNILWHLEEPIASPATIPLYYLAKAARQHVTVVLSGEGADELLGGYGVHRRMLLAESLHNLGIPDALLAGVEKFLGTSRLARVLHEVREPFEKRYRSIASALNDGEKKNELLVALSEDRLAKLLGRYHGMTKGQQTLDRMLFFDTKVWLVDDLLLKADKMSMASSMELRVPFLDHAVVEFCARLPVNMKIRGNESKVLLKKVLRDWFPAEFVSRPKKGFPVPIARWFQGSLRNDIREAILDSGSISRRILKLRFLEHLLESATKGVEANARKLWALYQLEHWKMVFGVKL